MLTGALRDVRVLDLTRLLPGPFCTAVLAEMGADVVKVEEPGTGDYARWIPPLLEGEHGFAFAAVNRGKRSLTVDLKSAEGPALVRRLAARADVVVESFRPGVLERLGLDPARLREENPGLVVARMSGYGSEGPLADAPGHDLNYEALAGIVGLQGPRERPVVPAVPLADMAGALYAAVAILGALRERDRTGEGAVLDLALADGALAMNALYLSRAAAGDVARRGELELGGAMPGYDVYACRDGGWIALGALEPKFWARFVEAVDRPDLADAHPALGDEKVRGEVAAILRTRPREEWVAKLEAAGVPASPVLAPDETLRHPYVRARVGDDAAPSPGFPVTGHASAAPLPRLGEHTDEVLREAGLAAEEIAALRERGVLG